MKKLFFLLLLPLIATANVTMPIVVTISPINVATIASRTSGVAPLAVFFDASATTEAAFTSRPFHEIQYTWSFGDPVAGAAGSCGTAVVAGEGFWRCGSRPGANSKNVANGPLAAHVFESPGTYTVCMTATDGTNTAPASCQTITVTNQNTVFSANTLCVDSAALPVAGVGGCPAGASVLQQSSFTTAVQPNIAAKKRILFNRGGTYTCAGAGPVINADGPGIIGAYGSGALPIIQATANSSSGCLGLGSASTASTDWRIMDLQFDGNGNTSTIAIAAQGGALIGLNQILMLRISKINANYGISFADPAAPYDQIFAVDGNFSQVIGSSSYGCGFIAGKRLAIMGMVCDATAAGGVHALRIPHTEKAVITNNNLTGGTFTALDLLGQIASTNSLTTLVQFSDNKATGLISVRPQNASTAEIIRDVIIERNWNVFGLSGAGIIVSARETTVRNNVINMSGGSQHDCVSINQRGIEPVPDQNRVYNVSCFNVDVSANFSGVTLDANQTNTTVKNLAAYSPNDSVHKAITGTAAIVGGNSSDAQVLSNSPFNVASPVNPVDFRAANYAIAGGVSVPVWSDFFLVVEPSPRDIGAVIH